MLYFKHNNSDSIKKELQETIYSKTQALEMWQNVKYITKKDGTPFANLSKNFEGAKISGGDMPELQVGEYMRGVNDSYLTKTESMWDKSIRVYVYAQDITDDTKRDILQLAYNGQPYKYWLTLDEIKKAVVDKIEQLKTDIKEYQHYLAICDEAFATYRKAIEEADKKLAEMTGHQQDSKLKTSSLYYAITSVH